MNTTSNFAYNKLFDKFGVTYQKDNIIFCEYEKSEHLYYIISGSIKLITVLDSKTEKLVDILKDGDYFGEMAVIDNAPRSATAIVHSKNIECLKFHKDNFNSFIKVNPKISINLIKSLSTKIIAANARLSILMYNNPNYRVLQTLKVNYDNIVNQPEYKQNTNPIKLNLNVKEISITTAIDIKKIQSILKSLEEKSIISIESKYITILNLQKIKIMIEQYSKEEKTT